MTTIVITLKNTKKTTDGGIEITTTDSTTAAPESVDINHHLDPDEIIELLNQVPEDQVQIRQSTHHPNWERGDPCPDCGNTELAVMELRETTYESVEGELHFEHLDEDKGPQLSIVCKDCLAHLSHVPYYALAE